MPLPMKVYRAFDREPIAELPSDDAAALERKLQTAAKAFAIAAAGCRLAGPHQVAGSPHPEPAPLRIQLTAGRATFTP